MGKVTSLREARPRPKAIEFFAGIGLARIGLQQSGFRIAWANDYEADKRDMYLGHFGETDDHTFTLGDIAAVDAADLPVDAALAWASSPCTDLSLAGGRAGLAGRESGTFWHFVALMDQLGGNRPPVIVLENVTGLATSHGGDDLAAAITAFNTLGYSVDVLALDARRFLPQSRPRLFVVGALNPPPDVADEGGPLRPDYLQWVFGDPSLRTHRAALPDPPAPRTDGLGDCVEQMSAADPRWWDAERTAAFAASLSPIQADRVDRLRHSRGVKFRTAYRRTRGGVAVWEVRPDDISGCLRTARGGSSKQAVVRLGNNRLQVRWMTPLEYARLMGADGYTLSGARNNQALFGFGDAVAVPVVRWLGDNYLMPLLRGELTAPEELTARVQ
ncbi:DNA cytosine methyltransferase [Mycolicibacterium brumae]|uniref:DNA (cytosine-5-)-methyltransferase n=1 Tax=Mycolicibacterium brumae TaxID=85968 RepID=A0A2G5PAL8_9MYCO|nr:DNA cytosine methyltransferase [Mycolicibacterium brumae]MCV7193067.1 DNA cytosine methyltransferase [Mycolicibacterium brumae]PIB75382.1 DNA cytosine methyltransferase [Mycolicibacterium brumae]UWW07931.1 DNA cytosine methyltransferase [Mycolicibacterium brumae]